MSKDKRYKLYYVAVFHPRPLAASGCWAGKREEVKVQHSFSASNDTMAKILIPKILNPYPKLPQPPNRSVHASKLVETDNKGKDIRTVQEWKVPRPLMRGNRQL